MFGREVRSDTNNNSKIPSIFKEELVTAYIRSLWASASGTKEHPRNVKCLPENESNRRLSQFYLAIHFVFIY